MDSVPGNPDDKRLLRKVEIVPYDPTWPDKFREEARRLQTVLAREIVYIHHIGSTSVPGLCAKPIIDILAVVREIDRIDRLNDNMRNLGYAPKGEFGLPGRRYFYSSYVSDGIEYHTCHVHAYGTGNPEIYRHLAFRDYLRANPKVAEEYGSLKKELARLYPNDLESYMWGKNTFIKETEQAALAWWRRVPVIILNGPVGVGKTAVAGELSELFSSAGIPHALIDFDALTECHPHSTGDRFGNGIGLANLADIWRNARSCGARCLLVARVVETKDELEGFRDIIPGADIVVVRLAASLPVLAERIRTREKGRGLEWHLKRAAQLQEILEKARVENYVVNTDGRLIGDIAREIMARVVRYLLSPDISSCF